MTFYAEKLVDKRHKTAYNKPVKRKIAMKGPMPSVPSLREKAVWCKAFTRKHGRATPELSVQSRAYLRR